LTSFEIIVFDEIDSTNAEAARRAARGETWPVCLVGLRQTAGRGRRGRAWETASGNLAATFLFTSDRPLAEIAQLSFVAALAAGEMIDRYVPPSLVSLKWPNDPMVAGVKTGGILLESGQAPGWPAWVAVGIGVNLAYSPDQSERPATNLAAHRPGGAPNVLEAVEHLRDAFRGWLTTWMQGGFEPVAQAWTRRAHGLGEPCIARLTDETVEGVAEGLDPDGALRLRLPDGMLRRITAGDVFFGGS
jgi:BirA family biotin operon repressor/biotin-[acetyl-CoA-carboxylase] ligase